MRNTSEHVSTKSDNKKIIKKKRKKMPLWKKGMVVGAIGVIAAAIITTIAIVNVVAADYRTAYFGTYGVEKGDNIQINNVLWKVGDINANGGVNYSGRALFIYKDSKDLDFEKKYKWQDRTYTSDYGSNLYYYSALNNEVSKYYTEDINSKEKSLVLYTNKPSNTGYGDDLISSYTYALSYQECNDYGITGYDDHWTRSGELRPYSNPSDKMYADVVCTNGSATSAVATVDIPRDDYKEKYILMGMNIRADINDMFMTIQKMSGGSDIKPFDVTSSGYSVLDWLPVYSTTDIKVKLNGYLWPNGSANITNVNVTKDDDVALVAMMTDGILGSSNVEIKKFGTIDNSIDLGTDYIRDKYHVYIMGMKKNSDNGYYMATSPIELIHNEAKIPVMTQVEPAGAGNVTPINTEVDKGERVVLTANANEGYRFSHWTRMIDGEGIDVSSLSTYTATDIDKPVTYVANFIKETVNISTVASPEYGGYVSGGGKIQIGTGDTVTLKASSNSGYSFDGWYNQFGEKVSGSNSYTIESAPTIDMVYTAKFTSSSSSNATIANFPEGMGRLYVTTNDYTKDDWKDIASGLGTNSKITDYWGDDQIVYIYSAILQRDFSTDGSDQYDLAGLFNSSGKLKYDKTKAGEGENGYLGDKELAYGNQNWHFFVYKVKWGDLRGDSFYVKYKKNAIAGTNNGAYTIANPSDGGYTTGDTTAAGNVEAHLNAYPNPGYEFNCWTWNDQNGKGYTSKEKEMTVSPTGIIFYTAHFKHITHEITGASDPNVGGKIDGLGEYADKAQVPLTAKPNYGYTFDKWTWRDNKGNSFESKENPLVIDSLEEDMFVTAHFKKTGHDISVIPRPGIYSIDSNNYYNNVSLTVGNTPKTGENGKLVEGIIEDGENATIEAIEDTTADGGYKFSMWVANDGRTYTDNPHVVTNITDDVSYIAVFEKEKYTLTSEVTPADGGSVLIKWKEDGKDRTQVDGKVEIKSSDVSADTPIILSYQPSKDESGNDKYEFYRWECSDGTKFYDKELKLTSFKKDVTYKAVFVGNSVNIKASVVPNGSGTITVTDSTGAIVNPSTGTNDTYKVDAMGSLTLKAEPKDGYKFVKWQNNQGTVSTDKILQLANIIEEETYYAVFDDDKMKYAITTDAAPVNGSEVIIEWYEGEDSKSQTGGKVEIEQGNVSETKPITLTAKNSSGYEFYRWEGSDGTKYTDNPLKITSLNADVTYKAVFVGKKVNISVGAVPDNIGGGIAAGSVEVTGSNVALISGENNKYEADPQTNITITATPAKDTNYKFVKFTDSKGNSYSDNPLQLISVIEDETYTAVFAEKTYKIAVVANPAEGGAPTVAVLDDGGQETGVIARGDTEVPSGSWVRIKANPQDGYVFNHWTGSDGSKSMSETLDINGVYSDVTYTAHYNSSKSNIYVTVVGPSGSIYVGDWVKYTRSGSMISDMPAGGIISDVGADETITFKAEDQGSWKFKQWSFVEGNPVGGSTYTVIHPGEDIYIFAEYEQTDNKIEVKVSPAGAGTVDYPTSVLPHDKAVITANANSGYVFNYFKDEFGNEIYDNPYEIEYVENNIQLTAVFKEGDDSIKVLASPASGGKVTKKVNDDNSVTITAKANRGYKYLYIKDGDGNKLTTSDKYTISAKDLEANSKYTAYFEIDKNYNAKSDITEEKFPNIRRLFSDPNYKFTRETLKSTVTAFMNDVRGRYKDAAPEHQTAKAVSDARAQFNEVSEEKAIKEAVMDNDSELITTLNEVMNTVEISDYARGIQIAEEYTLNRYGEHYTAELIAYKSVTAPEGFSDGNRTYLWKRTGAKYKDNLFLYYYENGERKFVVPIVDNDGTVRFTIDELGMSNEFGLVRVMIH